MWINVMFRGYVKERSESSNSSEAHIGVWKKMILFHTSAHSTKHLQKKHTKSSYVTNFVLDLTTIFSIKKLSCRGVTGFDQDAQLILEEPALSNYTLTIWQAEPLQTFSNLKFTKQLDILA